MKVTALILILVSVMMSGKVMAYDVDFISDTLTVKVLGTDMDARFEPAIIQVNPGDVIRFEILEGLHTVTAYHPENRRPLRIPDTAKSFDSGPLTKGDVWYLTITETGFYDYFCLPHERMGHAGRIISGAVVKSPEYSSINIPESVLKKLNSEFKQFISQNKINQ